MNIFKEKQIKIKINTNRNMKTNPKKDDDFIILTSSMIKIMESSVKTSSIIEDYPYFTEEVEYPWNYLQQLSYRKVIEIFFNRESFVQMLVDYNPEYYRIQSNKTEKILENIEVDIEDLSTDKNELFNKTNKISQNNIMTMLKCLFPTKYPYKMNIKTSYDIKIRKFPQINFDYSEQILKLFGYFENKEEDMKSHPEYSYLKLNGKTYTITEVIWMNDLFNHPVYKLIVSDYYNLIVFKNMYSKKLQQNINNKKELLKKFENINYDDAKNDLNELLEKIGQDDVKRNLYAINEYDIKLIRNILNDLKIKIIDDNDINKFEEFYFDIEQIIKHINNYESNIERYSNTNLKITNDINIFFKNMKKLQIIIKDIRNSKYIFENYFIKFNKTIPTDKKIINDLKIKEDLKIYISFFEKLNNINEKIYPSNNQFLQNLVNNIIQKDESLEPTMKKLQNKSKEDLSEKNMQNFFKILNPSHVKDAVEPFKNYIKYLYTGINKKDDYYEIYLRMDLIEGEINDDNKQNIKCVYVGEKLTDKLDTLISFDYKNNNIELNPRRMFFVLDDMKGYSTVGRSLYEKDNKEKDNKEKDNKEKDNKEKDNKEKDNKEKDNKEKDNKEKDNMEKNKDKNKYRDTDRFDIDPYLLRNMFRQGGNKKSKSNKKYINNTRKLKSYFMMN